MTDRREYKNKRIRLKFIFLLPLVIAFLYGNSATAQEAIPTNQLHAINEFYDGYNKQNYDQMRSSMHWLMKLMLTKEKLRQIYGAHHNVYGSARVVSVNSKTSGFVTVEVVYSLDTTELDKMSFAFSKNDKIAGLSRKADKFQYAKTNTETVAEESKIKSIDSLVQLKYKAAGFNGCVLVVNKGQVIYKNCLGYADRENKIPLNDSSMFDLASLSKQFTAMGIMILAEQGKLNYSDNVEKYIPGLPYPDITIENLLTHTSGLPDYMDLLDTHWDKNKFAGNADIIGYLKKYKPKKLFKPGESYEYSNTGYALLSVIIEKVSEKSYADYLSENIFRPLGMHHSRVYNTRRVKKETIANYAYGYVFSDSLKRYSIPDSLPDYDYVRYMDAVTGDGTVNSTITDLAIWDKALRENSLVQKNTFEKALAKVKLNSGKEADYGYGWELQKDEKFEDIAWHSGNWPGYISFIMHFIDKQNSVVILSNNEYFYTPKIAGKIAAIVNR